ncbi:MAG: serine hydrolase domain-containing protein [Pseudolysinimonas sp.]
MRSSRRVTRGLLACAAVAVLAGCAAAPNRVAHDTPIAGTMARDRIAEQSLLSDEAVASLVPATEPGCSAAVGVGGSVIWAGAGGLADLAAGTPVTTATRFDIASVSKQFTATAILMLQRDGLLSVSDPIGAYVDGLPSWGGTVTLDQLIHHTSRIPDFWVELDEVGIGFADPADQAATVKAIARETKLEPGSGYEYSNSNYVLLAEVVHRVSGLTLPDFLAQRIFEPLGLAMVVAPTLHAPDIARAYGDTLQLEESGWTAYGHTGIITTPSELARWGDQYRTGPMVQDDFSVGAVDEGAGELYAAAIDIEVDGDLNHTGRWGGYVSDFTVSADRDTTIAVICNGHLSNRFGLAAALWTIWDPPPTE